jgi:N-acetylglucosaminyldiphosphoundecaprenol N-acetyl-beta-D-mannosaminyltransferase
MPFPRVNVLGIPVHLTSREQVAAWAHRQVTTGDACAHVVTLNPEYVMTARSDVAFAAALRSADLVTIDGAGVAVAIRVLARGADADRVTGVDLVGMLAGVSAETGAGLFLLGAGPGIADRAAEVLRATTPRTVIAGTWADGTADPVHDAEAMRRIRESGAKVVFVAYGAPGQVHWIARNQEALTDAGVRLVAGIGGALDFVSGTVPRAPRLLRKLGLEWAYRLVREPWRWRRQLVLPVFGLLVLQDAARRKVRR